jgi:hypothetical protein
MYTDARNYASNCPECAIATGGRKLDRPPIPVNRPFQIVGVDIMDLPQTLDGNKHVLVFQDYLIKWPMVFPIPDQKTDRIVRIWWKILSLFLVCQRHYFLIGEQTCCHTL